MNPTQKPVPTLDYATASTERPSELKYAIAVVFAIIAILLGGLFALSATGQFIRSLHEDTTREMSLFRRDAAAFLACSLILIVPGFWYGRIGLRGGSGDRR